MIIFPQLLRRELWKLLSCIKLFYFLTPFPFILSLLCYFTFNSLNFSPHPNIPFAKSLKEIEIQSVEAFIFGFTACCNHEGNKIRSKSLILKNQILEL